jgi:hypothetical protein
MHQDLEGKCVEKYLFVETLEAGGTASVLLI